MLCDSWISKNRIFSIMEINKKEYYWIFFHSEILFFICEKTLILGCKLILKWLKWQWLPRVRRPSRLTAQATHRTTEEEKNNKRRRSRVRSVIIVYSFREWTRRVWAPPCLHEFDLRSSIWRAGLPEMLSAHSSPWSRCWLSLFPSTKKRKKIK